MVDENHEAIAYRVPVVEDFLVGQAEDAKTTRLKEFLPQSIPFFLMVMDLSVDLDDERGFDAIEVYDELADTMLPPELETKESAIA